MHNTIMPTEGKGEEGERESLRERASALASGVSGCGITVRLAEPALVSAISSEAETHNHHYRCRRRQELVNNHRQGKEFKKY